MEVMKMVVCPADHGLQADIIFVVESTAINGAYINDLKTNYIIPSLEYFSQGNLDETNYLSENANSFYGIVIYQTADCLPHPMTDTIGPFTSPGKLLNTFDKLELIGGKGESHANIAEGLATSLQCFEELKQKRDVSANVQKHCILVCNSPPYLLPVMESQTYSGKTAEQLAVILEERGINLSIISPRKIPSLYKLFEKGGGDLNTSQTKNYAKDPRHLVLLKGYSLKERPISPPPGTVNSAPNQLPNAASITSLPSPQANGDSPIPGAPPQSSQNLLGQNANAIASGLGQNPVFRPGATNPTGICQLPQQSPSMVSMVNQNRGGMIGSTQFSNQTLQAPPGYHQTGQGLNRPPQRWNMLQQRPPYMPGQQVNTTQGSALIAQLTLPPSSMPVTGINQFGQIGNNSPMNAQQQQHQQQQAQQQQQQQLRMSLMSQQTPNVQTSLPQNSTVNLQQTCNQSQGTTSNQVITSQAPIPSQQSQQMGPGRERQTIWQGLLEWIEKPKNPNDPQKITKHVPCQVSANAKDGEPELKADGWPQKLIMQLMPKQLIGNIGGAYLKNSKSVLFHPQSCEALESLTKVMSSGFAGCVHFTSSASTSACDIKVLILLYTAEKKAYLGFIPNDQVAFVDRLRKVIQQQKSMQMPRQGGGPNMNPQTGGPVLSGAPSQMPGTNTPTSQTTQQGLMISQTNTMTMGGGQITQNVVPTSGQGGTGIGVLGQSVPGGAMQPRLRMQVMPQGGTQLNQPGGGNSNNMGSSMLGAPVQRAPFENQLQVERQQNLEKINQLKQTLEAAQQQEQQYKNQLERISHMKTSQLQEALQIAQQTEMHYKMLDQQRMANPQPSNVPQPRLMRPGMSNNPGLRHLLQQQPQYRQQLMSMQPMSNGPRSQMGQQMANSGTNQQVQFDDSPYDFLM